MTNTKLEILYKKLNEETNKEGMISDYAFYAMFKTFFSVPNLTFYQFGAIKELIMKQLKR